jgi:hypothetical protein
LQHLQSLFPADCPDPFCIQVIWAIWLYKDDLQKPLLDVSKTCGTEVFPHLPAFSLIRRNGIAPGQKAVHYIYLIFTLITLAFRVGPHVVGMGNFSG